MFQLLFKGTDVIIRKTEKIFVKEENYLRDLFRIMEKTPKRIFSKLLAIYRVLLKNIKKFSCTCLFSWNVTCLFSWYYNKSCTVYTCIMVYTCIKILYRTNKLTSVLAILALDPINIITSCPFCVVNYVSWCFLRSMLSDIREDLKNLVQDFNVVFTGDVKDVSRLV